MKHAHIVGWGSYLPQRVLTNREIARTVDTSDEWIYARTGIRERRIARASENTATMAFEAAARALDVADMAPSQVELIIVATATPENMFPSTACQVQDYLGAGRAGAFDLSAACSGFIFGLSMAAQSIATGTVNTALVVGAETLSRVVDWYDRGTCILFGDGAGAVVLKGSSIPGGVMASIMRSDGSGGNVLTLPSVYRNPMLSTLGPGFSPNGQKKNTITMDGRQVFRFATRVLSDVIEEALEKADLTLDDVALIVPHQANRRIVETAAKRLKIEPERFYLNVDRAGNTSAASIPIALCEAVAEGRLKPDDNVVFVGFGGGLTWGANVVKWDVSAAAATSPLDRQWQRARYVAARGRSRLRQLGRGLGARFMGSPTPEARLKDADKRSEE